MRSRLTMVSVRPRALCHHNELFPPVLLKLVLSPWLKCPSEVIARRVGAVRSRPRPSPVLPNDYGERLLTEDRQ